MCTHEKNIYMLYPELIKYPLIINILLKNKNSKGICCVLQKDIAKAVDLSQTAVSKYLKRLKQYDKCVEKIAPGKYVVYKENMLKNGPVSKVLIYHNFAIENIGFLNLNFKEQVRILGLSKESIVMANQYFIQFLKKITECSSEEVIEKTIENDFLKYMNKYTNKLKHLKK